MGTVQKRRGSAAVQKVWRLGRMLGLGSDRESGAEAPHSMLVVGDGGFEPVGGGKGEGPEIGGGAVEGDGDFEGAG
jgi:hypothetical protein